MTGQRYFQRELSWLAFNRRVLEEAQDDRNPLLERAKFLGIVASNLDEFCMVRIPRLQGLAGEPDPDFSDQPKPRVLDEVHTRLRTQTAEQYACWREAVEPALCAAGLTIVSASDWTAEERQDLRVRYRDRIEPILTPLAVDPARPFPVLANGALHVAVLLRSDENAQRRRAIVTAPPGQRLIELGRNSGRYALLEEVIAAHIGDLFEGHTLVGSCTFRITRDGSLDIDEDQATDLLSEIEEELRHRAFGRAVRLELGAGAPEQLRGWLMQSLDIDEDAVVDINGPLDLVFLMGLDRHLGAAELQYRPFTAHDPGWSDPFATIAAGDRLLHHPYESFRPVVDLVQRAASDPEVLAIKMTLYRVSGDSPIIQALVRAARAGKQVTVLVELKARFDEERNIQWARHLEKAGAHVIYGLVGFKVHSKLLLIIRREIEGIRRYCHIGTGNYNDRTARLYTDLSYFTASEAIGREVAAMFNQLTGYSVSREWLRLVPAPVAARDTFNRLIRHEAAVARRGGAARITACFNSLFDDGICDELYAASQAGVEIDLVVRGICILRPGVGGLSEHIQVRSIVGRYLEHSRIFRFAHGGDPVYLIGSADWMRRNLNRRVECLVRIVDPALQKRLDEVLDLMLSDNRSARTLKSDGSYARRYPPADGEEVAVQTELMRRAEALTRGQQEAAASPRAFRPLRSRRGGSA